jgi:hypothetical protein
MATYFDPRSWSPLRAVDPVRRMLDPSWLDQWAGFTTSWLDPFADLGAGTVTALLPDVLITVLSEGIRSRFGGADAERGRPRPRGHRRPGHTRGPPARRPVRDQQ